MLTHWCTWLSGLCACWPGGDDWNILNTLVNRSVGTTVTIVWVQHNTQASAGLSTVEFEFISSDLQKFELKSLDFQRYEFSSFHFQTFEFNSLDFQTMKFKSFDFQALKVKSLDFQIFRFSMFEKAEIDNSNVWKSQNPEFPCL